MPEDEPINPSPWYGFAVERLNDANANVKVSLRYSSTTHRYPPKFSFNKRDWVRLDRHVVENADESSVAFEIPKGHLRVYVSAQPIIDEAMYETWISTLLDIYPFLGARDARSLGSEASDRVDCAESRSLTRHRSSRSTTPAGSLGLDGFYGIR